MTRVLAAALMALVLAPAGAAAIPAAPPPTGKQARLGYHLYGQYCIACHGSAGSGIVTRQRSGAGPGRSQSEQRVVAPSLRGVGALAADFYLRTGYMPLSHVGIQPRRTRVLFAESQIQALTAYIASLGAGPAIPRPHPERGNLAEGLHAFTEHCAGCHHVAGEGGYVTGAVAPPLKDATPTQIAEAVRIGPYVMPRFSKQAIGDDELDSIIAYVQYSKHPQDRGGLSLGRIGPVPEGLVTWFVAAAALIAFCIVLGKRLRRE